MRLALNLFLIALSLLTRAAPHPALNYAQGIRIPLSRSSVFSKRELALYANYDAIRARLSGTTRLIAKDGPRPGSMQDMRPESNTTKRATFGPLDLWPAQGAYHGTVTLGKQQFRLVCDTGSPDSWVVGPECVGSNCIGHTRYKHNIGEVTRPSPFVAQYVSGRVTGTWHTDTLTIAGLVAPGMSFGIAATLSDGFRKSVFPSDGVMGLSIPDLTENIQTQDRPPHRSVLDVLFEDNLIHRRAFSFKFSDDDGESELVLGYSNIMAYQETLAIMPVLEPSQREWSVQLDDITVDDNEPIMEQPARAMIDTGSSICHGPDDIVRQIYNQIEGSFEVENPNLGTSSWSVPCDTPAVVNLHFDGKPIAFAPRAFVQAPLVSDLCFGSINGHRDRIWIVGLAFLRGIYVTFEVKTNYTSGPRVIFAKLLPGKTSAEFRQMFNFPLIGGSAA